ncbi:acyl-coenzyme A thioesterase 13-like isoform X1 [Haemaphysalis longicornis]
MQRASATISRWLKDLPYCEDIYDKVKLVSCGNNVAHFEMQVEKSHCNMNSVLHGGMASTLIDIYTCVVLSTAYEKPTLFVTTELKTRFLGPAKLGDTILMEARAIQAGRTLAFAEMYILDKATKKVLVQGTHTAFVVPELP